MVPLARSAKADGRLRGRSGYWPTMDAVPPSLGPRNCRTVPMGLAMALTPLPAESRPTARGLVATS
jgi:hypothetical protein